MSSTQAREVVEESRLAVTALTSIRISVLTTAVISSGRKHAPVYQASLRLHVFRAAVYIVCCQVELIVFRQQGARVFSWLQNKEKESSCCLAFGTVSDVPLTGVCSAGRDFYPTVSVYLLIPVSAARLSRTPVTGSPRQPKQSTPTSCLTVGSLTKMPRI